jgi:hypothetical protein
MLNKVLLKDVLTARHWCLTAVTPAIWEIGRIAVQDQPKQIVHKTPSPKNKK